MIDLSGASVVADTPDGPVRILAPTSLTLTEARVALIGANGSGKSTLARLINGLVLPTAGSVRVGAPASGAERGDPTLLDTRAEGAAVRRLVGFVFTNPQTQLVMPTVIEDVALSLRRRYPNKAERLAAARSTLERFGLAGLADRSVHTLSGGQQQLLAMASVLATEPAIVVADEPTTLLDLRNARELSALLLGLPQQVIVATHDLDLAARCDRVLVIAGGEVALDSREAGCSAGEAVTWYRDRA